MPPRTRSALARYLDKVRRLYPHGIPAGLLKRSAPLENPVTCSLVVISGSGELSHDERDLIESIRSKALKLAAERCPVVVVPSEAELAATGQRAAISIIFGASEPLGQLQESEAGMVMRTHSLAAVQADQGVKRAVWGHLKAVLPLFSSE